MSPSSTTVRSDERTPHERLDARHPVAAGQGLARGVGGARGPGRLLPARRPFRLGGSRVHPHHGARAGHRRPLPHQSLRRVLRRDHRVEPREDRPAGQQAGGLAVSGEPGRLRDPQRHPRRAPRRPLRAAHPHAERRRRLRAARRASCPSRSIRSSCSPASAITTSRARRSTTTRSRASWPTSATRPRSSCATTGCSRSGRRSADAFVAMYYLETSCAIQVRAQSGGGELIPVPKEIIDQRLRARRGGLPAARRPGRARLARPAPAPRPRRCLVSHVARPAEGGRARRPLSAPRPH